MARPAVTAPAEDPAEVRLQRASDAHPTDPAAWLELGKYEEANAHPFEAMWAYAEAQRLQPGSADLLVHLAAVLQRGQVLDVAAAQLVQALRARLSDLELRQRLAELHLSTAEPERARSVMEERHDAVWQDADAVILLGRAEQARGDTAAAIASFKRSLSLQPHQAEAWYRLGRVYLDLGRLEEARDALFHAIAMNRSRPEHSLYAGMTFLEKPGPSDLDRAVRFFQNALAVKPSDSEALFQCGVALERMGKRQEALTRYEQAVLADLNNAAPNQALGRALMAAGNRVDGHRYLGRYYDLKDRPAQAAREFAAMQAVERQSVQPALLQGQIYLRVQQEAKAVAITEAALKRHPDDVQLLERLAVFKINRGDRPYARRLLNHWLQIDPKSSRGCWLLGRCDFSDMKYAEGIAWEEKALKRRPHDPHYLAFLGGGYLKLGTPGSLDRAAEALSESVARLPDNAEYRDLYAQVLQRLGRFDEARRQYLQALDSDPFRISCYNPVAQLAWRLNRPGAAAFFPTVIRSVQARLSEESVLWRRVWDHPEDAEGRWKLARFLCRTGDLTKARSQLEQALERCPQWPEARQLLATIQRVQGVL
jgi:Flp pilus assembly protein TadD